MVMMMKLTRKQKMVLEAIEYFIDENGYSPTYRELADLLNIKYESSIYKLILALEEKGYIKTKNGTARTIRIVKPLWD